MGAMNSKVINNGIEYSIQHSWANDYDENSCKTYRRNIAIHDPESVTYADVKDLEIEGLGKIDAFAYGFPCNDFSIVGERKGFNGTYGPLYTYGLKVLDHFKPTFFIAENVGGIRSANQGEAFRKILFDLGRAGNGYTLTANLYKAEKYGVPQTRHRVIIVGLANRTGKVFNIPKPTTPDTPMTVMEALELPAIPQDATNHERTRESAVVIERLKLIKPGQNVWNADLPPHLQLNVKTAKLSQIYKRLHPNLPSYTITGSGGGGTHGYHYKEPRALTNRERARIQTFPDDFVFEGEKESVRKQIGMAVPPKLAEIIFTHVLMTLAGVEYEHVEPNIEIDLPISYKDHKIAA